MVPVVDWGLPPSKTVVSFYCVSILHCYRIQRTRNSQVLMNFPTSIQTTLESKAWRYGKQQMVNKKRETRNGIFVIGHSFGSIITRIPAISYVLLEYLMFTIFFLFSNRANRLTFWGSEVWTWIPKKETSAPPRLPGDQDHPHPTPALT